MVRTSHLVSLLLGLLVAVDAAQVTREETPRSKQALRIKRTPGGGSNTVFSSTVLKLIQPWVSSSGMAQDRPKVHALLDVVSGRADLDPDAFRGVFESLRADLKNATNNTMQSIEATQAEMINDVTACQTNHGFVAGLGRHDQYVNAEQAHQAAVREANSKCETQDRDCDDRDIKAMSLHDAFAHVATTYHNHAVPTVFDLTGFYLKDSDDWLEEATGKHRAWQEAAILCASAGQTCSQAKNNRTQACAALEDAGRNGKDDYNACHQRETGEKDGYDATIPTLVANQKSSIENLEKVLCIVEVAVRSHGGTPRTDGQMSCTDLDAEQSGLIKYKCECTSPSSNPPLVYSVTYTTQLDSMPTPARNTVWDTKGCGGGGGGGGAGGGGADGGLSNYVTPASVTAHKADFLVATRRLHTVGLDALTGMVCYSSQPEIGDPGYNAEVQAVDALHVHTCNVLKFTEDKQVLFGPRTVLAPPSLVSSETSLMNHWGRAFHNYANKVLIALDTTSVVASFVFGPALHCFVLETSGSDIVNAHDAVDSKGQIVTQDINNYQPHFAVDRAAGTNTFVVCWRPSSGADCKLFSVSGRAVHEVGQGVSSTSVLQSKPNFGIELAVAGLTGTSAVACSTGHNSQDETQCIFMSWTAGDLNSLVFAADAPILPVMSLFPTISRLSDGKALLCYDRYGAWPNNHPECSMVTDTGAEKRIDTGISFSNLGGEAKSDQNTIALGPNKATMTYTTRRRNAKAYTLAMDIDEQTGAVTQAGTEVQITAGSITTNFEYGSPAALGSDRAFSAVINQNTNLWVVPQW